MRTTIVILLLAAFTLTASAQSRTHVVQQGETLYRIALRYELTVDQLKALNGLTGNVIRVGQRLIVEGPPEPAAPVPAAPPVTPDPTPSTDSLSADPELQDLAPAGPEVPSEPGLYGRYEVDATMSIFDIASATGLSVDSLLAMNPDLGPVFPDPGFIRVPVEYAVQRYRVRRGDTLFGIARTQGTTIDALRTLNELSGDRIRIGQELRIPGAGSLSGTRAALPSPAFSGPVSVYPERFAGRLTSGGDMYDPARFTAAHVDLPLGTLLHLTHPESGRSVFVEVNDRMPVRGEFVLEISGAAASALEVNGEAVEVRVLDVPGR